MLRVAVAWVIGILLAELFPGVSTTILWVLLGVSAIMGGVLLWLHRLKMEALFTISLWVALMAMAWLWTLSRTPQDPFGDVAGRQTLSVRLADTPHPTARSMKVKATVEAYYDGEQWHPTDGDIMLFIQQSTRCDTLSYGQHLLLRTHLQRPNGEVNPYQFDYRQYLRHKGILWQCYVDSTAWLPYNAGKERWSLVAWAKALQRSLVQRLRATDLSAAQKGIAEALLLGWRNDLEESTLTEFRNAGITHLLCVSGLHVGIVAMMLGWLLLPLGWRPWGRTLRGILQIAAIWLFVMITGMAPSTLRAGVMFTLLLIGGMGSLRGLGMNNLCTSAVILLLVRPGMLYDMGFQLSYAAVAGIILLQQPMRAWISFPSDRKLLWWLPRKLWDLACVSTTAQIGTLPLILYHFHQFPTWFLIANMTVVPFAGVLLITTLAVVLLYFWPWAYGLVTSLLRWELTATENVTRRVGSLPHAILDNLYCDLPVALMTAGGVLLTVVAMRYKGRWAWPTLLALLIASTLYMRVVDVRAEKQQSIVVYSVGRHWAVEYLCGRDSYLLADSAVATSPATIGYQRDNLIVQRRIQHTLPLTTDTVFADNHCVVQGHVAQMGETTLLVMERSNARRFNRWRRESPNPKPKVDIVLVTPGTWIDTARLSTHVDYDTLIHYPPKACVFGF